jgi:hypothetical protein
VPVHIASSQVARRVQTCLAPGGAANGEGTTAVLASAPARGVSAERAVGVAASARVGVSHSEGADGYERTSVRSSARSADRN